jgi:LPS-assembly protein
MTAKLDLDVVSDQDYLREFKSNYNGFNMTRDYYLDTYGRDIDDYNDPIRLNQLNLNRTWKRFSFNADMRWNDDVIKRRQELTNNTLQNLPAVTLDGAKQKIGSTPFYYNLESSYFNFYREEGESGHRLDLYPRVSYPMLLFNAFSVEPSAGLRQTTWYIDRDETDPDRTEYYRAIYDLKLDTGTDFYRIFSLSGDKRLKHNVNPRIIYEYIPEQDQSGHPKFDRLDRISPKNLITYSLTNTFVFRDQIQSDSDQSPRYQYIPVLRFNVEESFDIDKYNDNDDHPFSNILLELDLTPGRFIGLDSDAHWSPYDGEFYGFNSAVRFWSGRGDQVKLTYHYTRPTDSVAEVRNIFTEGLIILDDHWQLFGLYDYNFEARTAIETVVGFRYMAQCWSLEVEYKVEEDDQSVNAMIKFSGLGATKFDF